jgi:hypothetical protein
MIGAPIFRYALTPGWAGDRLTRAAQAVPSLDLNFAVTKNVGPLVSFTRASSATYIDSAGTLQTAAVDVPRFDHNPTTGESLGLLVEDQRTNSVTNNTMVGAVAGTPGTLPTGWGTFVSPTGLTRTIVGSGTVNGINYIDVRFNGTPSSTGEITLYLSPVTTATLAQAWTATAWLSLAGGSTSNIGGISLRNFELNSGAYVREISTNFVSSISSDFVRRQNITTSFGASANQIQSVLSITAAAGGTPIDITLRIGLPQLEQGAFATSVILTDNTAPFGKTRNADVANITGTNFSSWYRQDEGTIYGEYIITVATSDGTLTSFDDGTANNRWQQRFTSIGQRYRLQSGGVSLVDDISTSAPLINATNKVAHAIRAGDQRHAGNGLLNAIALIASPLPTVTQLQIATGPGAGNAGRITIRRLTYWPQRLPNSTLQAITQ